MKRHCLIAFLTLLVIGGNAQAIRVPAGKKFQAVVNNIATTTVTVMGQSVENVTNITVVHEYTVTGVTATGYSLSLFVKKVNGTVSIMGQEQKFDSDNESTRNSPQMAGAMELIGKPQEIKVENGHVVASESMDKILSTIGGSGAGQNDFIMLLFMPSISDLKQGAAWADSTVSPELKIVNQYLVTHITDQQVEMRVTADTKINSTIKQAGMEMQSDMKGFSNATRVYDRKTGLLISEKVASEMAGTAEAMGLKAPMTIKLNTLITIQ